MSRKRLEELDDRLGHLLLGSELLAKFAQLLVAGRVAVKGQVDHSFVGRMLDQVVDMVPPVVEARIRSVDQRMFGFQGDDAFESIGDLVGVGHDGTLLSFGKVPSTKQTRLDQKIERGVDTWAAAGI